jgi:prolyl-tRNA editing enzyme YbaK/EbsC (Cys-tRNA(Pro) deacylase)
VAWPEPVERVASYLREAGAEARLEEFAAGTPTAQDAARAVGAKLAQIVKSLVFDCDGTPVLAMVPGDRRADPRKIREAAGCRRARVATADEVRRATGFEPGAVAPFPLPGMERVLMDPSLLAHEIVWIGAGSTRHMASIRPSELARLARARQVDVSTSH